LSREALTSEAQLQGATTTAVRAAIKQHPELAEECAAAMEEPVAILEGCFGRLEYDGHRVQVHAPADGAALGKVLEVLQRADPSLHTLQLKEKQLGKHPVLEQALQAHMAEPRSD
jgi:hypothetical protein